MLFYEISAAAIENENENVDENEFPRRRFLRNRERSLMTATEKFNERIHNKGFVTLFEENDGNKKFVVLAMNAKDRDILLKDYIKSVRIAVDDEFLARELTFRDFRDRLLTADRLSYIMDSDDVLNSFSIENLGTRVCRFGENLIQEQTPDEVDAFICKNLLESSMKPEIGRIRMGRAVKGGAIGIPVHYVFELSPENNDLKREAYRVLLSELYSNGRIQSRRYSYVDIEPTEDFNERSLDYLYRSMEGGTVVLRYTPSSESSDDLANTGCGVSDAIAKIVNKFKNKVQTVIMLPKGAHIAKEAIYASVENVRFVEIKEDVVFDVDAENYLRLLCKEQKVKPDKALLKAISDGKGYNSYDLNAIFDKWFSDRLCTRVYPQYTQLGSTKEQVRQEQAHGSAYERLQELIGIREAKKTVDKILSYYKAQRLFADRGFRAEQPALHISLTGNPGTCKTTYARLLAEILKDNGILSEGKYYECGRADIVGKYVGWTAKIVQQKFRDARGSVLLIDEAYSLVDDREGLFGDEAINTMVQCMENMRDVVVIFAGYPDKMKTFLDRNPGLRSRINFHIHCDDYSTDELCDIARLIAKNKGLRLTDEALEKVREISENVRSQKDFGNGRFIRNLIEDAQMSMSDRLVSMEYETVTDKDLSTITAADITVPVMLTTDVEKRRPIGFSA